MPYNLRILREDLVDRGLSLLTQSTLNEGYAEFIARKVSQQDSEVIAYLELLQSAEKFIAAEILNDMIANYLMTKISERFIRKRYDRSGTNGLKSLLENPPKNLEQLQFE